MNKLLATLTFLIGIVLQLSAQESTLLWETHIEQDNASEYVLVLKASLKEGWHLYSQHLPEGGPLATEISFENPEGNFLLLGETQQGKTQHSYEEIFDMETAYFEKEAIFRQRISLTSDIKTPIKAIAAYQTCNDVACTFEPGEELMFFFENTPVTDQQKTVGADSTACFDDKDAEFIAGHAASKIAANIDSSANKPSA